MKIFDHKNPKHLQILKEELARAKKILNEEYSADRVWDAMSIKEKEQALSASDSNSDVSVESKWDEIPADVQDSIDLSDYELAIDDKFGRSMMRGIKNSLESDPRGKQFVNKFLKKIGRDSIDNITIDQAAKLNIGIRQFLGQDVIGTKFTSTYDPRQMPSGEPSKNRDWRGGMYTGD
jgi:hypothetical protein